VKLWVAHDANETDRGLSSEMARLCPRTKPDAVGVLHVPGSTHDHVIVTGVGIGEWWRVTQSFTAIGRAPTLSTSLPARRVDPQPASAGHMGYPARPLDSGAEPG